MNLVLLLVLVCVVSQLSNCPYVPSILKRNKQNLCWLAIALLVLCMMGTIDGFQTTDPESLKSRTTNPESLQSGAGIPAMTFPPWSPWK